MKNIYAQPEGPDVRSSRWRAIEEACGPSDMQSAHLTNGFSWSFILELEGFHHNGRLSRRTLAMIKRRFPAPVKLVVRTMTQPGFRWDEGRLPEGPPQLIFPRGEYRKGQEFAGHRGDRYVIEKIESLENGTDRATLKRQGYIGRRGRGHKGHQRSRGHLRIECRAREDGTHSG